MNFENKKPITFEIITNILESRAGLKHNVFVAVVLFFVANFSFILFVCCLLSFPLAAIPFGAFCGWMIYCGIKRIKKGKNNALKIKNGEYKLIASRCIQMSEPRYGETEDGNEYYTCEVCFENGVKWILSVDRLEDINMKVGEEAYLLYFDTTKNPVYIFGCDYYIA